MTERIGLEVETLTIRIPIRLQRRGGRKLIMTPEGAAVPSAEAAPRRDAGQGASALIYTEGAGNVAKLSRMASAERVQVKGLGA